MSTTLDGANAMYSIRHFIGLSQKTAIREYIQHSEESQHFINKMIEYAQRIEAMPKVYEQDGMGENAVAHLHYFIGGCDWWITEKDTSAEQYQAFGLADLGYGAELGYISIEEITGCGAELDLFWTPCTLAELKENSPVD